ncbi:hypothetical protein L9F63_026368, partial [Diploptera punctata]
THLLCIIILSYKSVHYDVILLSRGIFTFPKLPTLYKYLLLVSEIGGASMLQLRVGMRMTTHPWVTVNNC